MSGTVILQPPITLSISPRCFRNWSTSIRRGAPAAPPKRVHFSAAAALAKRNAPTRSRPSANANAKPAWKMSPAASVSTAVILNAGRWRSAPFSSQKTPLGPSVTARKPEIAVAILARPAPRSASPVVARRASARRDHVTAEPEQWIVDRGFQIEIDDDGYLARPCCPAYRRHKGWEAVVDQHDLNIVDQRVGVCRGNTIEFLHPSPWRRTSHPPRLAE